MHGTALRLFRYPVKGLSPAPMDHLALVEGQSLAHDRSSARPLHETVGRTDLGVYPQLAGSGAVTMADLVAPAAEGGFSTGLR